MSPSLFLVLSVLLVPTSGQALSSLLKEDVQCAVYEDKPYSSVSSAEECAQWIIDNPNEPCDDFFLWDSTFCRCMKEQSTPLTWDPTGTDNSGAAGTLIGPSSDTFCFNYGGMDLYAVVRPPAISSLLKEDVQCAVYEDKPYSSVSSAEECAQWIIDNPNEPCDDFFLWDSTFCRCMKEQSTPLTWDPTGTDNSGAAGTLIGPSSDTFCFNYGGMDLYAVVRPPSPPSLPPPSPPPPSPPPPSPPAGANGDPHLMLAHGGKADFRGTDKGIYNFLSAKNLSLNVMTEFADFYLHDTDHPRRKLVHGSFLTQAHVVAMTGGGRTVHASYWASKIGPLNIGWMNATIDNQQAFSLGPHTTKVVDDVSLHMDYSSLHVATGEWALAVTPQAVERSVAGPVRRIDVQMTPRVAESQFSVPPHGVIGQSWDGDNKAVFGKEDEFPVRGEYTTSAMAEGAIEGVPTDYLMASPYATDFKYSRFGLAHASPRDVSKLTGRVKAAAPLAGNGAGVMEKEMELSAGQVS